jgi:hypothetical protein
MIAALTTAGFSCCVQRPDPLTITLRKLGTNVSIPSDEERVSIVERDLTGLQCWRTHDLDKDIDGTGKAVVVPGFDQTGSRILRVAPGHKAGSKMELEKSRA